jgi:hypothetical protein
MCGRPPADHTFSGDRARSGAIFGEIRRYGVLAVTAVAGEADTMPRRYRYDAGVDIDGLRRRSDQGDRDATDQLIELAAELGDMNELRRLADAGNATATEQLIELATEVGDLDELRRLANRGNQTAADQLWELTNC